MLIDFSWVLIGISLIVWSADRLTDGAAAIAKNLGVPSFIVGLTIVAVGSSAPELFISSMAAISGNSGLAVGNALGSNIVNTALVLPIAALLSPIVISSKILRREMPFLLVISLVASYFLFDLSLSRTEGLILVTALILYILWLIYSGYKHSHADKMIDDMIEELPDSMQTSKAIFWVVIGLTLLIFSSDLLVGGAVNIAHKMGVSETIIGLTIIAIGTSLPELAASIAAALKKEHDMVLGNIIGSNIFNLLGVLGIAGAISPIHHLDADIKTRDIPMLIAVTFITFFLAKGYGRRPHFGIRESVVLLLIYIGYSFFIFDKFH